MILNRYERMIAKRYLLPGKGEGFIFVVAGFSVGAVALGVAALIIVMSVMNGFRAELFDKIVGLNGHAVVQGYDGRLDDWEMIAEPRARRLGVTSATPLIEQPLMASANGRVEGVLVRGRARRGHPPQPDAQRQCEVRQPALDHAGQRHESRSARGSPSSLAPIPGSEICADQSRRPLHPGRHRAAHRHLHRRRGVRGRRLRI